MSGHGPEQSVHAVIHFPVRHYNLDLTLSCGQAFRWRKTGQGWEGVVEGKWVLLQPTSDGLQAACATPPGDWQWLANYLQIHVRLENILRAFPADDLHLRNAVQACHGLRLLRQEPWECLASFILSSTKRIAHIQNIIERLCQRFGAEVIVPPGHQPAFAFPEPSALARAGERKLRQCGMGFRARALWEASKKVADGQMDLASLGSLDESQARERLMALHGVGPKIANCVLLFAYGFPQAFPVDVWITRALRKTYFPRRRPRTRELEIFARRHFGPYAGYAQQYLFHYWRARPGTQEGRA